ncbi:MAG TPA: SDR family NAD(P)-dependent oxidoreductase [Acidimicrobiales bacterium]
MLTPFGQPVPRVVVAAARAGAFGILDLGAEPGPARDALALVASRTDASFGVRVSERCALDPSDLPEPVDTVVVADPAVVADPGRMAGWRQGGRWVVAEVRSADEARAALAAGADGLVAKGAESGGRVGTTGAFVLAQQVRELTDAPLWVQGGIGLHTAPAAVVGGATGVVVDGQVALLREMRGALPRPVRAAIAAMDGSETRVVGDHRVYTRPDLWVAGLDARTTAEDIVPRLGTASLADQALPVGQDTAAAARLSGRFGTVGGLVDALRTAIAEHVDAARRTEPLAPGRGVAEAVGTRYPVVQGPMTRVSDRAPFAAAVAEGGGLPFLALALLRAPEVRPLLEETKELLGDRPWGVGVLGFVPKELRDEQLEAIRDVRPPLALIAGGRPSQAAALEEVGIRTFLHVPAPGLLERFLKDSARRFVFEGFECGGHVGPRSSFALWEAQVEVLLEWGRSGGRLDELDVLFAGGIHDERSAAMVAALAAPLAEGGARVGVLMGTAYLFTQEAVAAGAIGEEFQAQALACERTALLESGPGHQTRCAESPFVETFEQTRRRLMEEGAEPQVQWAELENLNLGRLRVASKGLKREGDQLVTVDRDEQRTEGMFMIGDVATLRGERTTVAELHETVSAGGTAHLAAVADDLDAELGQLVRRDRPEPQPVDVAIVGMACVMPGALDLDEFWRNIVEGVNSITEVPRERWDPDQYYDPTWDHQTASLRSGSASKWGGFLPDIPFDAFAYGIPPASLAAIEPTQLLALKVAADALVDAGYAERPFDRERTSVVFGAEGGTDQSAAHGFRALFPSYMGELPPELDDWLPKISEDSFPGLLTNVIAGRIANRLDLGGRNITVDAACASSLAALDVACSELAAGTSDVVLCGGADLHNGVQDFLLFTSVHALSTTGQCRTFDESADGIALGEGVACVVLKRLADAERDGDRIYAVVRAVGASSDGRSLGLTAPRQEGQERAVDRAYAQAGVAARDVGLVEAHGTGTTVGDRTELATLTEAFTRSGMERASCVVGSVKSNIGHTKCTAGLAGLIKAAKAVYHGVRPPTLNITRPNPGWDPETSPFVFLDESRPWPDERRVAGVSAFGFGGTNFHAVIESHPDDDVPSRAVDLWPAELVAFRGDEATVAKALDDLAARLAEPVPRGRVWRLADIAAAVSTAGRGPVRVAIVADDIDDLRAKVDLARRGEAGPGVYRADAVPDGVAGPDGAPPRVAFLFPGQGSQRPGMANDLFVTFAETRSLLRLGARYLDVMLPPAAFDDEQRDAQRKALTDTRMAQPTLGLADLAAAKVLDRFGVRPDMVAGHSYGELVALTVAGALDEPSLLALSEARAAAILEAVPDGDAGGMVAVSAPRERVDEVLDGVDVVVANANHPSQLVVAGTTPAIEEALGRLRDAGIGAKRLPVACAFHSPVVARASETLARYLDSVDVTEPRLPVYSNLTADLYPADGRKVRDLLANQVANGVRFTDEVRAMYEAGARVFVEVGPGRVLTGCVERTLGDAPHLAVATDRPGEHGVRALLQALGQLAVAGVDVDVAELFEGRSADPTAWTKPAPPPRWTVNGHLVRNADGDVVPGGLRPADTVPRVAWSRGAGVGAGASLGALAGAGAGANGGGFGAPGGPAQLAPAAAGAAGRATAAAAAAGGGTVPADQVPADQVLVEYFRAAHEIIGAGHQLVLNYLGYQPAPANGAAAPALVPLAGGNGNGHGTGAATALAPAPAGPPAGAGGPAAAAPAAAPAGVSLPAPEELLARLTAIVSARTGYPEDMLGPDLDVEADLSIDSIKRLEILGELADEIGLTEGGSLDQLEDLVEELAARKTLRGIVDFLFEHTDRLGGADPGVAGAAPATPAGDGAGAPAVAAPASGAASAAAPAAPTAPAPVATASSPASAGGNGTGTGSGIPAAANRFITTLVDAPLAEPRDLGGLAVRVTGAGPVAAALASELADRGAGAGTGAADVVVVTDLLDHLGGGDPATEPVTMPELYARIRPFLLDAPSEVVVVTPLGGGLGVDPPAPAGPDGLPVGAGARGLVKTAALELDGRVRLVDVDPAAPADALARTLADEVGQADAPVEVAWRAGRRRASRIVPRPDLDGRSDLRLSEDSVVLLTGGARGITARVAVALARRWACRVELVGRSALPEGEEPPELAACGDRTALRAALVRAGQRDPKAIERECDRILAGREVAGTLAALRDVGSGVTYHQVDVRDAEALTAVVQGIYERHGRLDGIVHGAGVLDDHFIADKTPEAFERVFATKVDAARTLVTAVRRATAEGGHAPPAFVAFFGSIAGVCGNRGQADYAAANDALDAMAATNADLAGRVFAVDWGPWSTEAGMVDDALARLFEAGGMGLIQVDDGTGVLLDEISAAAAGAAQPAQVTVARCAPELLAP